MTLTEISYKLQELSINAETYGCERLSEEMMVLADYVDDLENDVTGTILGLAKGLKDFSKRGSKLILEGQNKNQLEILVGESLDIKTIQNDL